METGYAWCHSQISRPALMVRDWSRPFVTTSHPWPDGTETRRVIVVALSWVWSLQGHQVRAP